MVVMVVVAVVVEWVAGPALALRVSGGGLKQPHSNYQQQNSKNKNNNSGVLENNSANKTLDSLFLYLRC